MVVVFGPSKAEVRSRVGFVEVPYRPDGRQLGQVEQSRPQALFSSQAASEISDEVPLIEDVGRTLEGVDALRDLDDRRDGRNGSHGARRVAAVLAGELEREVAAQRVAGHGDRL